jgi:zinc protease
MKIKSLFALFLISISAMTVFMQKKPAAPLSTVFKQSKSPLVDFRIQFLTGALDDPKGKEGLAALTAAMISQGGTKARSYDEITEAFYPMAAGFSAQTDKEMTTFIGTTHVDNLDTYYGLVREMMFTPGFRAEDFSRLKQDAINYLKSSLRNNNDEELGKERLYNLIYTGHPYESNTTGRVSSLESITIEDVKAFYAKNYNRANVVLGLSGNFSNAFKTRLTADFAKLPAGSKTARVLPAPKTTPGIKIDIVQRETQSTAISLGFPIAANRKSADYAALALVASYFGQHRSSNSYLYQKLREKRGLNYGDYAYIEYFPRGMFQFDPDPNLARQQQIFQIWIRPVEPRNGHFTLRAALFEYDKLARDGMSQENFDNTKNFLIKYVNILTQTQSADLGYALDSKYYGIADYNTYMKTALAKLTLADVNRAIKKYLAINSMTVAMVTKDAEGLRKDILSNKTSSIKYDSEKPQNILDEDKIIQDYRINVKPEDVTVTPVEKVFE